MNNKLKISAVIVLFLMIGSTYVEAQFVRGARYAGRSPLEYCLNIPGLTDAQKEQIVAINDVHRKKMDDFRVKRQTAPSFEEMNEIGAAMLLEQNDHFVKVSAVLTAEQLEYLNSTYITTRPQAPRQAPGYGYGRGAGRGYGRGAGRGNRNFAPGRGFGRSRGYGARW